MPAIRGATSGKRLPIGLALLAVALVVSIAACGDGGGPDATPAGTLSTPAQGGALRGTGTATPTAVGGETAAPSGATLTPSAATLTPSAATPTPAMTTATPAAAAATPTATASGPATLVVGFDMDPSGNDATTLANVDRCVSVSAASEDEFQVDVFLDELPEDSALGFSYSIDFPDSVVTLVAQEHSMLMAAEPGTQMVDISDDVPASTSPHLVAVADMGPAEYNPPYTQGVLGRYTFKVLPTATEGTYSLSLIETAVGRDTVVDARYPDYPIGGFVPIAAIWDGAFEPPYGIIAVDAPCP